MSARKGDPEKEIRGTEGAAPEAARDAADAAREAAGEQAGAEAAEASSARAGGEAETPVDEEPGRPKRRGRRRKADADAEAEAEAAAAEAEAEGDAEPKPKPKPKPRRRRSAAETTTSPRRARRELDGDVLVRARAKYVRCAPRKARLVVDHIRGKSVDEARAILTHTPRAAAQDVLKVLNSAVANAEHNHELDADELVVRQAFVDEGPTLKRYRPRALGRATRIRKRTSHLTIAVSPRQ